jgi:hypothetical protein
MAAQSAAAAAAKKKAVKEEAPAGPVPELIAGGLPRSQQEVVFRIASQALAKEKVEKDQAAIVKKEVEKELGGMWHCIIGSCYGVSVSNETKMMLFFKIGLAHVLVFRTLDEEDHALTHAPAAVDAAEELEDGEGGDEDGADAAAEE